jgi:hypothetical protein
VASVFGLELNSSGSGRPLAQPPPSSSLFRRRRRGGLCGRDRGSAVVPLDAHGRDAVEGFEDRAVVEHPEPGDNLLGVGADAGDIEPILDRAYVDESLELGRLDHVEERHRDVGVDDDGVFDVVLEDLTRARLCERAGDILEDVAPGRDERLGFAVAGCDGEAVASSGIGLEAGQDLGAVLEDGYGDDRGRIDREREGATGSEHGDSRGDNPDRIHSRLHSVFGGELDSLVVALVRSPEEWRYTTLYCKTVKGSNSNKNKKGPTERRALRGGARHKLRRLASHLRYREAAAPQ